MRLLVPLMFLLIAPVSAFAESSPDALAASVQELRNSAGTWEVVTEFLAEDGSVANTAKGNYQFDWVIEDRVLQGSNSIPSLNMKSGILFYVSEERSVIEMVSVGKDGKLWIMTGPLGGDTRTTQPFATQDGGEAQLRFTRYNVTERSFESRMEYTEDGGESWKPGNHQVFTRIDDLEK